ncbi:TetR/AcrR family transcriptional regulator [Erwinia psidii]|uniref:TetR/AcrR family transcriptional regulator n=1 Tax=Erwinia psidii TaxID=69224 RepID=A0A3N6RXB4_9GAMM|nr:TetR/AcrR family transcriptional regulator [Erwinia psidii]MCX8956975.1 TetR/AcrR family transcriptional regulator [Erwinia psidii]MCX8960214.1 TetR/AcrR family transcriptional regulator [Erwinia psidii]MCX8966299.1 TetR/AcrR family transcriptional regulator [Erwinia psidii]RQM37007.1 TetR/AcrR family transcriptional regulator [Erwinia psidii]
MKQRDPAEAVPLTATRARTRRLLIATAMRMFDSGAFPSITEVAAEAQLSRATAYRYFPTQSALVSAIVTETLSPIKSWRPTREDVSDRIDELLSFAFPKMLEHEGTLRAALHLSLTQWAQSQSARHPEKERLVRGNRKALLQQVVEPLKNELPPEMIERVVQSLSLVYGSEIFLVMKDIWGADNDRLQDIGKWIAKAIIRQAREDYRVKVTC